MLDSWGDGWNGASLDLFINGVLVIDNATVVTGYEETVYFEVEEGDVIDTYWTSGSYDSECSFGIYDATGALVTDSETAGLELSLTVIPTPLALAAVLDLTVRGEVREKQ